MNDPAEGLLHVFGLLVFVLGEAVMKPQDRDAVRVHHAWIDVAVGVVVRDHFAAAGEADGRSEVPAVIVLELLAVAALAVEPLDPAHDAECGGAAPAAAELDVVAAWKIELPVVEPPRTVQVHPADAILVVRHAVRQLRHEA